MEKRAFVPSRTELPESKRLVYSEIRKKAIERYVRYYDYDFHVIFVTFARKELFQIHRSNKEVKFIEDYCKPANGIK